MLNIVLRLSLITIIILLLFSACKKNEVSSNATPKSDSILINDAPDSERINTTGYQLTEYDTPPSPIQNPMPQYPVRFKSSGIQGVVVLDVLVLSDGSVGDIKVIKSLLSEPGGLDDTAVATVKTWLFKPAMKNEKPIDSRVTIPISFSLRSAK
jgi:TonB family protein